MFFILFVWRFHVSLVKYFDKRTSVDIRDTPIQEILFPSISVCPNDQFKKNIYAHIFENISVDLEEIYSIVDENVWKRNETFFFVNAPTYDSDSSGYPCLTTKEQLK